MSDYRVDAATKEEWAERAFAAERKLDELQKKYIEYIEATTEPEPSTWHYQLMKHTEPDGEVWYGIHENYRSGGYTVEPVRVMGESKFDIKWMLESVLNDIEKHGVKDYE